MFHRIVLMIYVYLMYASSAIVVRLTAKKKHNTEPNEKSTTNKSTKSHKPFQRLLHTSRHNSNIGQTLSTDKQFDAHTCGSVQQRCFISNTHTHTDPYTRNDRLRFQSKRIVRLTWSKTAIIESIRYMHELKPIANNTEIID